MNNSRLVLAALIISLPMSATAAGITIGGLPDDTVWYMHADLEAMRDSASGSPIYAWFEGEVMVEINEELGIDLNAEVNSVTAFSESTNGAIIIVEGPLSKSSQEKMLAIAVLESTVDTRLHNGMEYYFIGDGDEVRDGDEDRQNGHDHFDDLEDVSYSSFAIDGKAIITSSEDQLKELLDNGGKIAGSGSHDGALFVMSADTSFVQAGLRTDGLADDDDDWNSNIIRNTKQAALLVSDSDGMIAVEAKLVSTDPKMAEAIGGIVNGLISLQAFNSELGPEIQSLIRMTEVDVNDNTLSISTVIDPEMVLTVLNE
jgi:hypothetical protein